MLWAAIVLIALAILVPAPLAPGIQEGAAPASESLAPWFFLWVQQLLRLGDPFIYGVLIPLGALLILALVPYITPQQAFTQLSLADGSHAVGGMCRSWSPSWPGRSCCSPCLAVLH